MSQTATASRPRRRDGWRDTVRPAIYIGGMMPAVWLFYLGFTNQLGADPVATLERSLGLWSLKFLIAGLAVTPIRDITGFSLIPYRRAIGLVAFFYAALHLFAWLVFDRGLDRAAIWADIVKRPYITVGMLAFTILLPLAITSNNATIKRLGAAAWKRLHKWVYAAVALGIVHFMMVEKVWALEPLIYAALVGVLLAYRIWPVRQKPSRASRAAR